MKYNNIHTATFISRPNRFIAKVEIGGEIQTVHVKNTGRCKELLQPGNTVYLEKSNNPERKTAYDLVAVDKIIPGGTRMVNMDSMAPNKMAGEWLASGALRNIGNLRPEVTIGDSRYDFAGEENGRRVVVEVKGCTLEENGVAKFPDAPTERGVKHIRGLAELAKNGARAIILIVIQMKGVHVFRPNWETHEAFGNALVDARNAGVEIVAVDCNVIPGEVKIDGTITVDLIR